MSGARGRSSRPARQSGLSLIELMVALVITMMASLLMFQTMTLGEGGKRTARGGKAATLGDFGEEQHVVEILHGVRPC